MKVKYELDNVNLKCISNDFGYEVRGFAQKVFATVNQIGDDFFTEYITTGSDGITIVFKYLKELDKSNKFLNDTNRHINLSTKKKIKTITPSDIVKILEEELTNWCDNYIMKCYDVYLRDLESEV